MTWFPGYEHLLEVRADPQREQHRDAPLWLGNDFDPDQ